MPEPGPTISPLQTLRLDLVEALFDPVRNVAFYAKDLQLRYVAGSKGLRALCHVGNKEELVGRSAGDFFLPEVRDRYEALERRVLRTATTLWSDLGLWRPKRGGAAWLISAFWPVVDDAGDVWGVAGVSTRLEPTDATDRLCRRVKATIDVMKAGVGEPPTIRALSQRVGISRGQLTRDFITLFGMSPTEYFSRVRIEAAIELLHGDMPVTRVAQACGYSDHSAFTRRFKQVTGVSPSEVRQARRESGLP